MLDSIRLLRGLAAILVIVYHACEYMRTHGFPAMADKFQIGAIGVDLFFAVSGFVMLSALDNRGQQSNRVRAAADFIVRRVIRIAPIYWLGTSILYGVYVAVPGQFKSFTATFEQYWRSMLFLPSIDGGSTVHPLLNQGWTLYHEMYFYALISLAILFGVSRAAVVAVTAIVAVSIAFSAIFPSNHTQWLELASAPINCEFAFGAFVYLVYSAGLPRLVYCTICVVLIAAGAGGYDDYSRELGWSRVSSWGVSSAGVLLLFLMLEKHISQWLGWLCRYVGDTSYSLYIFHGLAFSFVDILLKKLPWRDVPGIQIVCLCLGAGIVSNVLFVMVERPFTANAVRAWRGRFGQIKLEARAVSN